MSEKELSYFRLLKKQVAAVLRQSVPGVHPDIEHWKGQEIVYFQDDLELKVKGRISEKWFYTHIKDENNKLPRIDILNLLSKYAGDSDWADFKLKNEIKDPDVTLVRKVNHIKWMLYIGTALLLGSFLYYLFRARTYEFCFVDSDKNTQIVNQPIEIILLKENQSPRHIWCNNGCFSVTTREKKIQFVVKTAYYKVDTIVRLLHSPREDIHLKTNDYALMIHYFSKANKTDWAKRRKQLDGMIADNALIYQVYDDENIGMELFNKQEFIDKLTMPVRSLNNIEIIETLYAGSKISLLKFRQKLNTP
jgi:hypothetical protein